MTTVIRPANEADLPSLASLESSLFSVPWSQTALAGHLSADHTLSLLLFEGDDPVGYLLAGFTPPEGELYRIAVLPDRRRRGYGRRLLDAFLEAAKAKGASDLWLEVRESNAAAISLYRAAGFALSARRDRYYRDPTEAALVMTATRPKE